jgi:hypothetical protein
MPMPPALSLRFSAAAAACALALLSATQVSAAAPGCRTASAPAKAEIGDVVRQFYAWYLDELRAGRRPSADPRLRSFISDDLVRERRGSPARGFDPVLLLPDPASSWSAMQVTPSVIELCRRPGLYQAYVYVRYSRYRDPQARTLNGTHFVGMLSDWAIGLNRTPAGWRIMSLGSGD